MAKSYKFEGVMSTDDESELTAEEVQTLVIDALEMGLVHDETGITYFMENGDFEVTEEGA